MAPRGERYEAAPDVAALLQRKRQLLSSYTPLVGVSNFGNQQNWKVYPYIVEEYNLEPPHISR